MTKSKRYYPIVENFDEVKGLELEGPFGTVVASKERPNLANIEHKIEEAVIEKIQDKMLSDERYQDGDYLLKVKKKDWSGGSLERSLLLECDVYRIKQSKKI